MSVRIVPLTKAHMTERVSLYKALSEDSSPWTKEEFLLDLPLKWDLSFAVWDKGPLGYCILSKRSEEIHLHQIMVARSVRGNGLGTLMLGEAVSRGVSTLKVHPENLGAIRFYQRYGFHIAGDENGYLFMRRAADPSGSDRAARRNPQ